MHGNRAASGERRDAATGERAPLSKARIGAVALDLLDTEGVTALTMRGLAQQLGVRAPSLYNHVEGLDEVIDLVQEIVNQEIDHTPFSDDDLRSGLAAVARSYRAAYLRHPNVLPHVVRRVMRAPTALALYEGLASFLTRHGLRGSDVLQSMAMIDALVLGSTLDTFHAGFTRPRDYALTHPALAAALGSADLTVIDDAAFESALLVLVDQVAELTARRG